MLLEGHSVAVIEDDPVMGESLVQALSLEGCHVGEIEGYVISGHVPPEDIRRLLAEKPKARGLVVPGMPMGSPGMDMGPEKEPYEVLLLGTDGKTSVYAAHT